MYIGIMFIFSCHYSIKFLLNMHLKRHFCIYIFLGAFDSVHKIFFRKVPVSRHSLGESFILVGEQDEQKSPFKLRIRQFIFLAFQARSFD